MPTIAERAPDVALQLTEPWRHHGYSGSTLAHCSAAPRDDLVEKAVAAGGTADTTEDFGFMYTHAFVDLDGHGWGLTCMSAPPPQH